MRNIEFLKKWADALINGKYKQNGRRLRNYKNEFCCLGVACDLLDPTKWDQTNTYYGNTCCLPKYILDIIGISRYEELQLIHLNDNQYKTFPEIGQYIKENFIAPYSN